MTRIFTLLALVLVFAKPAYLAQAGDFPGEPCQPGEDCQGQQNPQDPAPPQDPGQQPPQPQPPENPPENPQPLPPPGPIEGGFCSGLYEGYYTDDPAPVTFDIQDAGQWGELRVTAWWRGGMWYGQGSCRQTATYQAAIELYFPSSPVHRGVINTNGNYSLMEGRVDYGRFFRLQRTR